MSFKITGPGEYKMRGGGKAVVTSNLDDALLWPWQGTTVDLPGIDITWSDYGIVGFSEGCLDIIGPWADESKQGIAAESAQDMKPGSPADKIKEAVMQQEKENKEPFEFQRGDIVNIQGEVRHISHDGEVCLVRIAPITLVSRPAKNMAYYDRPSF